MTDDMIFSAAILGTLLVEVLGGFALGITWGWL